MATGDTCVSIGAAFENLEVESDREKVKRKRDAAFYVKDKQGRRRFHGAFTGGFSAGYYNTVGTEEGWAPSQFVSSRADKANLNSRKPEDFMDEEDLEEFGIAPRQVATKDEFLLSDKKAPKRPKASLLEDGLCSMIVPARSTIGAQLLHKMGWKEGQGVGPRVAKKIETDNDVTSAAITPGDQKVYGCVAHPQALDKYEEMMQKFLFAPDDVGEWSFTAKGDFHGLGYSGIDTATTADSSVSEDRTLSLYGMSGQAFGVGALEEEDDDIYEVEKRQHYDHAVTDDGGGERQFGWTGPHSIGDRWTIIECFVKASKTPKPAKKYRCPPLPRDYRPFHKYKVSFEGSLVASGDKKQPLNAATRGRILGEEVSVFNLISPEDRQRIEKAKQQGGDKRKESSKRDHEKKASRWDQTPQHTTVKLPEWTKPGYKPFADDPAKQARYEDFLSGKQETCSGPQYLGMTEWEKQRERTEFAKAADVYQPLATSLESKFTRGETAVEDEKKQVDDGITRQTLEWHPHKILCRRFDVPEPYPHSTLVGLAVPTRSRKRFMDKAAKLNFVTASQPVVEEALPVGYIPAPTSHRHSVTEQESDNGSAEVDEGAAEEKEAVEQVPEEDRPPIDLFKSIFTESSASELSEEEDSEEENKSPNNTVTTNDKEKAINTNIIVKEQPKVQQKQLQEKSQHSTTEAKCAPVDIVEPKLTWMGMAQTTKPPEHQAASIATKSQRKPSVAAIASTHYGPSIPPSITANRGSSGESSNGDDATAPPDKKRHKKKHKKHTKQHKSHKRKHKH